MNRKIIIGLAVFSLLVPVGTFAKQSKIINSNNVEIPYEDYINLKKLYSEQYIDVLTKAEYDDLMNKGIDFDNIITENKYYKTEYNNVTGKSNTIEITKSQYDAAGDENDQAPSTRATVIETGYKRLSLNFCDTGGETAFFAVSNYWKQMPQVRSFDVLAARLNGLTKVNGTQSGKQIYKLNGTTSYIYYNSNGTNINNRPNGFGISMNLLDSAVTYLECTINSDMIKTNTTTGLVAASYQHATQNVSLATSKSYSLGTGGLGNVIIFSGNIDTYYDGMDGVYKQLYW